MKKTGFGSPITGRKYAQIMGVDITSTSTHEVLGFVRHFWASKQKFVIFTPNPELVLMVQKDKKLRDIVNSADLNIPDGVGLTYASRFLGKGRLNIIPGRKLFVKLVDLVKTTDRKAFFLGGGGIKNVTWGPNLNKNGEPMGKEDIVREKEVIGKINEIKPDLLFVGFGMPKQEKWIHRNLSRLNIGGAMTVGGTFSYIYGQSRLPPGWMEKAGLEWLWRLLREPRRVGRIFNAVVVFPLKVLQYKYSTDMFP